MNYDDGMFCAIKIMSFYAVERMHSNAFMINVIQCVVGYSGRFLISNLILLRPSSLDFRQMPQLTNRCTNFAITVFKYW